MVKHATNGEYHIGYVQDSESLLETLPQGIYQAYKCQKYARYVRYRVEKFRYI